MAAPESADALGDPTKEAWLSSTAVALSRNAEETEVITNNREADEGAIRGLLDSWANAVRAKDYSGILARHSADILMFDVPPPMESKGIEAYTKTWDLFFSVQPDPIDFDVQHMDVVAGEDVAFVAALMRCAERGRDGQRTVLEFRLTVGLRKVSGEWVVVHEHHSVPAA